MIVKQALFITLLSFYLALLSDSQQILEKKNVVVDIDKSLTKYLVKFYKVKEAIEISQFLLGTHLSF